MKKNTILRTVLATLLAGPIAAQVPDTVRVTESTRLTTTTTTVPVQTVAVAPAPATVAVAEETHETPPLRHGEFGVRYMPTFYALDLVNSSNETVEGSVTMSHGWGVMLGFNISPHWGITGEISYLQVNQQYKDRDLNRTVHIDYLNIPVMLSLNTNKERPVNLNFVVGPQFGLNVGSSIESDGFGDADSVKAVVAAKPGDVGLAYGAGLEFALNRNHTVRLDLGFRGYYGFVNIRADQSGSNPDTYNVLVNASRKTYAAYLGITLCF